MASTDRTWPSAYIATIVDLDLELEVLMNINQTMQEFRCSDLLFREIDDSAMVYAPRARHTGETRMMVLSSVAPPSSRTPWKVSSQSLRVVRPRSFCSFPHRTMWPTAQLTSTTDTTLDMLLPEAPLSPTVDGGDTTGGSTDSGAETTVAVKNPKKRKATYYVRKDAIDTLQEQIKTLQEELTRAKSTAKASLREAQARTLHYEQSIERNHLLLAGSESMLSAYKLAMGPTSTIPLQTYIHLPADPSVRDQLLAAMWRPKVDTARRFMTERLRFLDLRYEHKQEDIFRLPNGDVVTVGCDTTPFTSGHSVKQVFDAFKTFVMSQEITISERLGVLTIRENEDLDGFQYGHSRFLSTLPCGLSIESNSAMFASYDDATNDQPASAIATMDFIDQDDRYPYEPELHVRKEMTTALSITEIMTPTGRIVTLAKWGYVHLRMPTTPLTEDEAAGIRDTPYGLTTIMNKIIHERLATQVPKA